jgi:hypothetical protein
MTDKEREHEAPEQRIDDLEAPEVAQANVAGGTFHLGVEPEPGPFGGVQTGGASNSSGASKARGGTGTSANSSDENIKQAITTLADALEKLRAL